MTYPIRSACQPSRRQFLSTGVAAAWATSCASLGAREFGPHAPPQRYPDPDIVVLDDRFKKYKLGNSAIQRLYHSSKMLWAEGPAWSAVGRYLLWSDIPNNVQMRWLNEDGHVSVLRHPAGNSNGNTFDYRGRQIACEHGTRRVVRYELDGGVTVLASRFDGKPLNAPNDAVVHPRDGAVWFTDPGYGSLMNYEGHKGKLHLKRGGVPSRSLGGDHQGDRRHFQAQRALASLPITPSCTWQTPGPRTILTPLERYAFGMWSTDKNWPTGASSLQ